jgi:glycopeptide antibiotics resistance protein
MNKDAVSAVWYFRWANRLLIVSLIGIIYFTLFPFRLDFSVVLPANRPPYLLGSDWNYRTFLDFFLNFLLFVPFGFGLAAEARKRSQNWVTGLLLALAGGCFLSYTIEFLQLYVPSRNSAWDDVFSNTLGSVGGCLLFEACGLSLFALGLKGQPTTKFSGAEIFRQLSRIEDQVERWMSLKRASLLLLIYFGAWFGVSASLQRETRLSNWDEQCPLTIGNDSSGQRPWKGQISRVQIWSRTLTLSDVEQLTKLGRDAKTGPASDPLVAYEFLNPTPSVDKNESAQSLVWQTGTPFVETSDDLRLDGKSWLSTKKPVNDLVEKIKQTSQFTLRVTCTPESINTSPGQIVSVSQSPDETDLSLRQIGAFLGFWFRNPLSADRATLSWYIPGVFSILETEDIFITYNGSEATAYVNGRKLPQHYRLSAGASLAHRFFFIRTEYLAGYEVLYSTFVFLPSGMLIGLAARKHAANKTVQRLAIVILLIAPPILLELYLAWLGHREISVQNMLIAVLLACVGAVFINADRHDTLAATPKRAIGQGTPAQLAD